MPTKNITTLFWDVGGVLLSNAWDGIERQRALDRFALDASEFDQRHKSCVAAFEQGELSLSEYLDRTIFYLPRAFTREAFQEYMLSLSQPKREVLAQAQDLAKGGKYLMATLNNESRELNLYRIQKFGLEKTFTLFISSCFVGLRKPDEAIYRLALDVTQKLPEECCFIDDRIPNVNAARQLGMHAIQMIDATQLRQDLDELGVKVA
ncbi:MAG: HAD family phosphatase [Acidobacteriales bacterium]|nr:HAD family phosphatase [Terriglobales bacterium]